MYVQMPNGRVRKVHVRSNGRYGYAFVWIVWPIFKRKRAACNPDVAVRNLTKELWKEGWRVIG